MMAWSFFCCKVVEDSEFQLDILLIREYENIKISKGRHTLYFREVYQHACASQPAACNKHDSALQDIAGPGDIRVT